MNTISVDLTSYQIYVGHHLLAQAGKVPFVRTPQVQRFFWSLIQI